jgi:hypothetical protein
VLGALIAGVGADIASPAAAITVVAALTAASGLAVALTNWQGRQIVSVLGASSGA